MRANADAAAAVSRTLSRPTPATTGREVRTDSHRLSRGCDLALDLGVGVLASWTIVYHLCLLLRLAMPWAVGLEVVALTGWGLARLWFHKPRNDAGAQAGVLPGPGSSIAAAEPSAAEHVLVLVTVAAGAVAALLVAANVGWPAIAALWLSAAGAGTGWAVLRLRGGRGAATLETDGSHPLLRGQPRDAVVALAWAVALAALSTFTLWPNPDDLYYVNLSQWIVEHGTFPLRDTIFSDLQYPMSSWPPMASYDALVGTLARLGHVHAASVAYIVVPPVATFLSVLALWRLLRAWRVEAVELALSAALLFLLFDGGSGYAAPGNLFLIRIWQGKVILLCLLIPLLLVYALRYVERPTWGRAGWLFAGGVAAVGLTTTAMFLVPLVALGGAAPLCLRHRVQALRGFAAMAAYPLATGALTVAVGGRSADLFESRELFRFDPAWFGHEIFRYGPLAALAVAAVLAGALLVPHPAARVTTGVLALVTGVTLVPGFTRLTFDVVGLGPTLWRVSWVSTVAALVGVLAARAASYRGLPRLGLGVPLVLLLVLVVFGVPIWSERNGVDLAAAPHWQRGEASVASAQRVIAAAEPGDVVLSPEELAVTIDVLTTRVKTVAPRAYFMDYLRHDPSFHFHARLTLVNFANRGIARSDTSEVAQALTLLDVDEVCLPAVSSKRFGFLAENGYRPLTRSARDRCVAR